MPVKLSGRSRFEDQFFLTIPDKLRVTPSNLRSVGQDAVIGRGTSIYGLKRGTQPQEKLERVKGIEPSSQAWEAHILPLNHTREKLQSQELIRYCCDPLVQTVQTPACLVMLVV